MGGWRKVFMWVIYPRVFNLIVNMLLVLLSYINFFLSWGGMDHTPTEVTLVLIYLEI
jgi:hypothetical protein